MFPFLFNLFSQGYWGNIEGKRRRSKPPETLQLGKNERRGSVGSVNSDKGKESPAPIKKGARYF